MLRGELGRRRTRLGAMAREAITRPLVLDAEHRRDRDHDDGDERAGGRPGPVSQRRSRPRTGSLDAAQRAGETTTIGRAGLVERFGDTEHAHVERVELRGARGEVGLRRGQLRLELGEMLLRGTQQRRDRVADRVRSR